MTTDDGTMARMGGWCPLRNGCPRHTTHQRQHVLPGNACVPGAERVQWTLPSPRRASVDSPAQAHANPPGQGATHGPALAQPHQEATQ